MFELLILWLFFCFLSFGFLGLSFFFMKKFATKSWRLAVKESYRPKVSILVPTYNESSVIGLKLENLSKVKYSKELTQIVVIDSNSKDQTAEIAQSFVETHREMNIQLLTESERKGKSEALNLALKHCDGNVIIVSDADCFWPSNILERALPYLFDPCVGAISGPKTLLNATGSWVTRNENSYLNAMNLMKLGQSKLGSTTLFEGGFSAYKREALNSFDPYHTGSDDCGTIIALAERKLRALLIPEAQFYTTFPETCKGKLSMKIRRANQLVRVFWRYLVLLVRGKIKISKGVIIQGIWSYLLGPLMFLALIITTVLLVFSFPYFALVLLIMFVPRIGRLLFEAIYNYLILLLSIFSVAVNKRFLVWSQPEDRSLLDKKLLQQHNLI